MAISKNEIKFVQALHQKKYRQIYDNFIAEGEKIARETLLQSRFQVSSLFAEASWLSANQMFYAHLPVESVRSVSAAELERISTLQTPNSVLLVLKKPSLSLENPLHISQKALFLDDIQDPGNLGAILRIADWFGIPLVVCAPGTVELYNPKVIQATMGAFLRVRVETATLEEVVELNPGLPIMGAVLDGENVFQEMLPGRGLLVIGNESKGISVSNQKLLSQKIAIHQHPEGGAESLNAAVATGILVALWQNGGAASTT